MNKSSAFAVRWQVTCGRISQRLDDGLCTCEPRRAGWKALHTVLPEPFQPTMRVSGVVKTMVSPFSGPKERMPWIIMRSIFDMTAAVCDARSSDG